MELAPPPQFVLSREPFAHLRSNPILPPACAERLLFELGRVDSWCRVKRPFYELEFLPSPDRILKGAVQTTLATTFSALHAAARRHLGLLLDRVAEVQVHRHSAGAGIGLHSDAADSELRLAIMLGSLKDCAASGYFLLVDPESKVLATIEPAHNLGIAFPTTRTLHAVTEQYAGTRFSLVASFRTLRNSGALEAD